MKNQQSSKNSQKFGKTIWNDIRQGDLKRTLRLDLKDIYQFYLDEETKIRLKEMSRIKRWIYLIFWLFKSLLFRLSPTRRILFLFSLVIIFTGRTNLGTGESGTTYNLVVFGIIGLLIVLALELKDKLLAQNELMVGRTVQFALMPEKNPEFPGWDIWLFTRPANEVGGDLVDYIKINKNQLAIAMGDVAGKGLGAALYMAKLQATLRAIAPIYRSLSELGAQMNTIFCRDSLPNRFASLIYIEMKSDSRNLRLLNAGHMPPLLVQEQKVKEIPHGDPALGIQLESSYHEQNIELHPGNLLFIYSDGLTEARNEQGDFFGEKRMINVIAKNKELPAKTLGNKIIKTVDQFIGDARPNDDLSLILIRVS